MGFDLAEKYNNAAILATYGEDAALVVDGKEWTVSGIFQSPVKTKDFSGASVTIADRSILFDATEFALTGAQAGDQCTVKGVAYTLLNPAPDGHGMTMCALREYAAND
jgi:hypothetical protein